MRISSNRKYWILAATGILALVYFLTPVPTALAQVVWHRYGLAYPALLLNRSDAELAMQLGDYYFGAPYGAVEYDLRKAERAYQMAVSVSPEIEWAHYQLARLYFVEGRLGEALREISEELGAHPHNLRSLYVRGLIYGSSGELEKAARDFKRFTEWAPTEWAGYNDLAWIYAKDGHYRQARDTVLRAFKNAHGASENPWLWNALGVAELNLGEKRAALAAFEKARSAVEELALADWRRAYPGNRRADAEDGLEQFKAAIEGNILRAR